MEKEGRFMETIKATIVNRDEKHFIQIQDGENTITVPISEDDPNVVKAAFNKLIERLRKGLFKIELDGDGSDLFSQIAKEYITQLNVELAGVYDEIKQEGFIEDESADDESNATKGTDIMNMDSVPNKTQNLRKGKHS